MTWLARNQSPALGRDWRQNRSGQAIGGEGLPAVAHVGTTRVRERVDPFVQSMAVLTREGRRR
jgi:hypothetical protein